MKKTFKRISAFLLLMIMAFGLIIRPNIASAKDDNYYILELPSNAVDEDTKRAHYNIRDYMISELLMDLIEDGVLYNNDRETPLLDVVEGEYHDIYGFQLHEGVTEDDLIIELPEDTHMFMEQFFGVDFFAGYSGVRLVLTEFNDEYEVKDETMEFDFSNISDSSDLLLMNAKEYYIMGELLCFFDIKEYEEYKNAEGKILAREIYDEEEDEYNYELGSNLTAEDNLVFSTSENSNILNLNGYGGINITDEDKVVLMFVEQEYDDSYYVIDYTSADNLLTNNFLSVWEGLKKQNFIEDDWFDTSEGIEVYKDGDFLLSFTDSPADFFSLKYKGAGDVKHNSFIDISNDEELIDELQHYGIEGVNYLSFIFTRDIELVEGEQTNPTFKTTDPVSFELDLDYNTFKDTIAIIDNEGNLLTKDKDYTLSEGSIIVTLTDSYLDKIGLGEHSLIASVNGATITLPFTIATATETAKETEPAKETTTDTKTNDKETEKTEKTTTDTKATESATKATTETKTESKTTSNPKTLDNVFTYLSLFAISALGVYASVKRIKHNN